jgi:hypothetical protein
MCVRWSRWLRWLILYGGVEDAVGLGIYVCHVGKMIIYVSLDEDPLATCRDVFFA